jgi:hypothetical protein
LHIPSSHCQFHTSAWVDHPVLAFPAVEWKNFLPSMQAPEIEAIVVGDAARSTGEEHRRRRRGYTTPDGGRGSVWVVRHQHMEWAYDQRDGQFNDQAVPRPQRRQATLAPSLSSGSGALAFHRPRGTTRLTCLLELAGSCTRPTLYLPFPPASLPASFLLPSRPQGIQLRRALFILPVWFDGQPGDAPLVPLTVLMFLGLGGSAFDPPTTAYSPFTAISPLISHRCL